MLKCFAGSRGQTGGATFARQALALDAEKLPELQNFNVFVVGVRNMTVVVPNRFFIDDKVRKFFARKFRVANVSTTISLVMVFKNLVL